ncbi:Do family serine endopeptidase [Arcobacter sp.]|uniref:Do family serine endopeptidase n=1 Tax=Arcobacter sp. TaxID=1872629 RepID=UPI003C7376B8
MKIKNVLIFNQKLLIISSLLAVNMFAKSIDFDMAAQNPQRVAPSNMNQILSFNDSIKNSMLAVVNISTKTHMSKQDGNVPMEMFNDPLFRRFFGDQFGNQFKQNKIQRALGSGVIVSKDGYIITNNHVVENADEITVTLSGDTTEYTAKVIGKDADSDLAVIKINAINLTPIKVANADDLKVGDLIFAIGNPFGIGETVTQGIISALNKNRVGINRYENFIQTDASINPGNSGGALVDSRGALIGINSAIITRSGGNNGIGFAIPINMVKEVATKLVEEGKVTRGYLGVVINDLTKESAKVYNHKSGALILEVGRDTPAAKYGLKRGDLIYAINNKPIKDRAALQNTIASFKPNAKIILQLERDKKDVVINAQLGNRDGLIISESVNGTILGGLQLSDLDTNIIDRFRLPRNITGVLITNVKPKSDAEKVGFQAGDVIIQIEDITINRFSDVQEALRKYNDKYKRVYVNRQGQTILLVIK